MKEKRGISVVLAIVAIFLAFKFCLPGDQIDVALDKYEEFKREYQEFLAKFATEDMDVLDNIDSFSSSQLKRYLELEERFNRLEEKYNY